MIWRNIQNMSSVKFLAAVFIVLAVDGVESIAPDQMSAPTINSIKETNFTVNFASASTAVSYIITVAPRHAETGTEIITSTVTSATVDNLSGSTLYDVSVKAVNSLGETGADSPTTAAHTLPEAPTIRVSNPFPKAVYVFFDAKNSARISQWKIEYREKGSTAVPNTADGGYYVLWLSGLTGNTEYEVRGRASQLYETTTLTENEVNFSAWQTFTTDFLSVFGRVRLAGVPYTNEYSTQHSSEWNSTLAIIEGGYNPTSSVNSISIIRIQDSNGNPLAHYQLRVTDKTLPSSTDYTLSGSQFADSVVHNDPESINTLVGEPTMRIDLVRPKYTLAYAPSFTMSCAKLVDRYLSVTQEDGSTFEVHLNVAAAEETSADEDDSIFIIGTGLYRDDGVPLSQTAAPNSILGFNPRFITKDCLRGQAAGDLNSSYTQFSSAKNQDDITEIIDSSIYTTSPDSGLILNYTGAIYTNSSSTLYIPAIDKTIRYEILVDGTTAAILTENEIDGSVMVKFIVPSVTSGTMLSGRILTRQQNGTTKNVTTTTFTVTLGDCSNCTSDATCISSLSGVSECVPITDVSTSTASDTSQQTQTTTGYSETQTQTASTSPSVVTDSSTTTTTQANTSSSTTTSTTAQSTPDSGLEPWVIAVIVVSVVAAIAFIAGVGVSVCKNKTKNHKVNG